MYFLWTGWSRSRCFRLSLVAIVVAHFFSAPGGTPVVAAAERHYQVNLAGETGALANQIRAASHLFGLVDRPPSSLSALRKRAEGDLARIRKLLRAEGYYGGSVDFEIAGHADPISIVLSVSVGERYRLEPPTVVFEKGPPEATGITLTPDGLGFGDTPPARSVTVLAAEHTIVSTLEKNGYPLAVANEREVIVDHATKTVRVTFVVTPGPYARFGEITLTGLGTVDARYVRNRIRWTPGARYDPELVQETRRALSQSRLFESVRITLADEVATDGMLPVEIAVVEARPRIIGAGVGYSTDKGARARGFWEHRNLLGSAERFRIELAGSFVDRRAGAEFVRPDLFSTDQLFIATANVSQEETEAFDGQIMEGAISVERPLTPLLVGRAGISIELSSIRDNDDEERFALLGLPLQLRWDSTDDALDPTRGTRTRLVVTPFVETLGADLSFASARLNHSAYLLLDESNRIVLASWGSIGTIRGATPSDLPADKRFYAGGGGSIRGYGFQLVGPVDRAGGPLGGRSVLEFGSELRARVYEDFGGTLFVEGGMVFDSATPDFEEPLLFGAGFGLRYYTGFGLVRADIAFPLDRRTDVDDSFQLYVSIGQAF